MRHDLMTKILMSKTIKTLISAIVFSGLALLAAAPSEAGSKHHHAADGAGAKGRGGYSYSYTDSINTYGNSRSNNGGADVYRDPNLDRQTNAGPFDHGFFFDSGMGSHGGDSPYMN
jgi:hypothetical protein